MIRCKGSQCALKLNGLFEERSNIFKHEFATSKRPRANKHNAETSGKQAQHGSTGDCAQRLRVAKHVGSTSLIAEKSAASQQCVLNLSLDAISLLCLGFLGSGSDASGLMHLWPNLICLKYNCLQEVYASELKLQVNKKHANRYYKVIVFEPCGGDWCKRHEGSFANTMRRSFLLQRCVGA